MITTKEFWLGALERLVKTFLQTFVAVLIATVGADAIGLTAGLGDVDWLTAASVGGLAAVLSLATSIGNAQFVSGVPVEPARRVELDPPA